MTKLRVFTVKKIMELRNPYPPCYNPAEKGDVAPDWTGTVIDVLRLPDVPIDDKWWFITAPGVLPEEVLRLAACDFAERAQALVEAPDPRCVRAIEVARRYAVGEATDEELEVARKDAAAARDAAYFAADPAYSAAAAAYYAACDEARAAGVAAAGAYSLAYAAAAAAGAHAAYSATACAAAYDAYADERQRQIEWLIERLIELESEDND